MPAIWAGPNLFARARKRAAAKPWQQLYQSSRTETPQVAGCDLNVS